jgi:hypothetical protein
MGREALVDPRILSDLDMDETSAEIEDKFSFKRGSGDVVIAVLLKSM